MQRPDPQLPLYSTVSKLSVLKVKNAVADGGKTLVVSDDYRGQPMRSMYLLEQAMNALACFAVEVTRRLVCEKQAWPRHKRPRKRYPGLLTAGQLSGPVRDAIRETHTFEQRRGSRYSRSMRASPDEQRHHRILNGGKLGQQVMKLENETNFPVPKPRQVYITEFKDVKFANFYRSCAGTV
jgi:hypothetical protein